MRGRFGFYWDRRGKIFKKVDCVWRADLGGGEAGIGFNKKG